MEEVNQKVFKGYKFRINPTEEQKAFFDNTFGACRYVWNFMLDLKKTAYLEVGTNLNYNDLAKGLTEIKEFDGLEFLNKTNSQSIQSELRKLDVAYTRFFKKQSNFPRFKSRRDKQSFSVPQHFQYSNEEKNGILYIPKVKTPIRVVHCRKFGDNHEIKSLTISKNKCNKYFVSFLVEEDKKIKPYKSNNKIGIDLGLNDLMAFSDGTKIKNPKIAKLYRKRLEYKCRQLSKKVAVSKNKEKSRLSLSNTYEKILNIKQDYIHKLTSKIISENQVIVMEDLNVSGMMRNHKLARSIQEVSWYEVVRQLEYKAKWNNRQFIKIGRFFPSSKTCSNDGFVVDKLPLSVREWTCPKCGMNHDRDTNAARNILKQGLNVLSGAGTASDVKQKSGEAFKKVCLKKQRDMKSMNHESARSLA